MATVTRVDNVDPRIIYSGTWVTFPNNDAYNNTISLARDIGTTATLNFVGNSVAAFGQLGPNPPNAPATTRYQVDDGDPTTFAPASPSTDLHQLLFYQSPTLPYGSHKLVMTNVMDLDWIWFDYFEVTTIGGQQPPPPGPSSSITPASTSNSALPTSNSGISTTSSSSSASGKPQSLTFTTLLASTPSTTLPGTDQSHSFTPFDAPTFAASTQGTSSSGRTSTSAIVGAVVGSLLFLAIIGAVLLFCLKKRRRNAVRDILPQESVADLLQAPASRNVETWQNHSVHAASTQSNRFLRTSSTDPLSASTVSDTMYTSIAGERNTTEVAPFSKARLQLATVTSTAEPSLLPYSVN